MAEAALDLQRQHRAAAMRELRGLPVWEVYAQVLDERFQDALRKMRTGTAAQFDYNKGYLDALEVAVLIPQTIVDEARGR